MIATNPVLIVPREFRQADCATLFHIAGGDVQRFTIGADATLLHGWKWSVATVGWDDPGCLALLSVAEQQQLQRLVRADDRIAWQRHRAMLRTVLGHLTGCAPTRLDIAVEQHGKPWLPGWPQLRFNLSHSGANAVLVTGAAERIGVDIEATADPARFRRLAQRYFPLEAAQLDAGDDTGACPLRFVRVWTAKEAYLKALGTGLLKRLNSFELELDREGRALGVRARNENPTLAAACEFFSLPEAIPEQGIGTVAAIWRGAAQRSLTQP